MLKTRRWSTRLVVGAILMLMSRQGQADPWYVQHGEASWYGKQFHGRKTADGDRFSQDEMTAAHRTLPLGTKVIVENPENGQQVEVKINDRGPYAQPKRRIIDLSRAAADSIGIVQDGTKQVRVVVTEKAPSQRPQRRPSMRSRWEPLRRATTRTKCSMSCASGFLRRI